MATPDLFEAVKDQVPAAVVLDEVLGPSRRGRWLCPFHDDHTPSLSERNGGIRCWSCAWAGDSIRFIGEHLGLSPLDAVHHIANIGGVIIPSPVSPHRPSLLPKIRREINRVGKEIKRQSRIAIAEAWCRIFRDRHRDEEWVWGMVDAACALERMNLNRDDDEYE